MSIFGFKRTAYGDKPKKKQEIVAALKDERLRDRDAEKLY